jgi:hypothetical protein
MRITKKYVRNGVPLNYSGVQQLVWAAIRLIEGRHHRHREASPRNRTLHPLLDALGNAIDAIEDYDLDAAESATTYAYRVLADCRRNLTPIIKFLRRELRTKTTALVANQLEAAVMVDRMLGRAQTHDLLVRELNQGKVECPHCSHIFAAEDHTID